jgi:hypothetical protein
MVINTNQGSFNISMSGSGIAPFGQLTPSSLGFGNQLLNTTSAPQAITLTNTGGVALQIASIVTSGDFAQTNSCPSSLNPGAGCIINVSFTPVARGNRTGTLTVNSNSFAAVPIVSLSGNGQAILVTASTPSLTFPLTSLNTTSAAQSVTLTNSGDLPAAITGVTIGGVDYAQTNTCGASLDAGATCTFSITFTPSVAGVDNDTLTITGNFGSPIAVALNGLGQAQGASGTLSPAFLVFPNQAVGTTSSAQTLTYTNTGTVSLSINFVQIQFGPFAETNTCGPTLAPGASCTIDVTFTPPDATGQSGVAAVLGTAGASTILSGYATPQLESPTRLDFGRQAINGVSPVQTVTFTNPTSNPISIGGWSYALPFNVVNHCGQSIPAGASCGFDVTFAPTSRGPFSGFFQVTGNFPGSPAIVPTVGRAIGAAGTLSPVSLAFANQTKNTTSASQAVTLTNKGDVSLTISGIQITGDFAQTNNCPATLALDASCTINVSFTPTDTGTRTGSLSVASNAVVAIAPVALSGLSLLPTTATFSPQSLNFGSRLVGTPSTPQTVTLTNTGPGPLSFSLGLVGDFSQTNNCGALLAVSASCTINLTFTPIARGTRTGTLTVTGNFSGTPPSVNLSGAGLVMRATASPVSLSFAATQINTTSAGQIVTLTNSGDLAFTLSPATISGDFSQTNNCPASLNAGASCNYTVIYAPTAVGFESGNLLLSGGFGQVTVPLSGIGQGQGASATLSPSFLVFPNQPPNTTSAPQVLTYTNTGSVGISVVSIGINSALFAQTNNCPSIVAPGASCTLNVTYTPADTTGQFAILQFGAGVPASAALSGSSLPQLESPTSLDFGTQTINTVSPTQTVTFTNTTSNPIFFGGWSIISPFNLVSNCFGTIAVGASCTFNVTFAPTAHGSFTGSLEASGNFPGSPFVVPMVGKATGAAGAISPASLLFGNQAKNSTSPSKTVTLTNKGDVLLNITGIQTTGDFAQQSNNCVGTQLAIDASCTIFVDFTPTDIGTRTGSLSVASNAAVPIVPLALSGTGVAPTATYSATSLTFAPLPVGTSSPVQHLTLTNTGPVVLNISSLAITGGVSDFTQTNNCGSFLSAGASCTINVTFKPSTGGARSAAVSLVSDSTPAAPAVTLSGTGQVISVNPTSGLITFGAQQLNTTSAPQQTVFTNNGDLPVSITGVSISGDFAQTNDCPASLAVGASCTVTVTFSPTARGTRTGSLSIAGNFTGSAPLLNLQGTGQALQGSISPASLSFTSPFGVTSASQTVTVTNSGDLPLSISSVAATTDYAQTNTCGTSLAVGLSCTVSVSFTPSIVGSRSGSLTLNTNSAPPITPVNLSGNGTLAAPSISPVSLAFAAQPIGSTSTAQSLTLTNNNPAPVSITSISAGGDFTQTNNCGSSLAAGASCTVNVSFTPTARGSSTATVSVAGNFVGTPVSASLSGTGQAILATASPASLTFAAAPLNTTSVAQTITFTNTGDTTAVITGVAINGDFAQTNTCGTSLAAGASCSINVTFTPTARGSRTGTVTLQGNFTSPAPIVNLSGMGQASLASLTPAAFDFGNEPVNTSSNAQVFTYTNTGDLALTISSVTVAPDFSQTNNCPASLVVNTSCTITVTFVPRSTGTQTASLAVSGSINSSSSVTGTGVMPLATLSPASLSFGNQRAGTTSAPQLVTVTNSGAFPFFVNQVSFPGPYQATNNCSGVIAVGASCTVSVVFAPSSSQSGSYTGSVSIGGDFTATPASVGLSGTAIVSAGTLSPAALTFANQNIGTTSPAQTLTLANTGNGTINLSGIQASGDFAQSNNCGTAVAPGTSCSITVTFTPTAHGARSGALTVSGDFTGTAPSATLSGNGTTPTAGWSPASLSFANQLVNSASPAQPVTLTNSGDGPLTITAVTATGDFAQTNNCGLSLAAASSCTINVTFTPTATGTRTGSLSLTSNSSVGVSPIALSGTGTAPAAVLSPTSLGFGNQLVNTSSPAQTVTLSNPGTATLNINLIKVTGDFSQSNNCGTGVAPGASCSINVMFTPRTRGAQNVVLTVSTTAPGGNNLQVALTGSGVGPVATMSASSLTFAAQLVNTTSPQQALTLTNSGETTLNVSGFLLPSDFAQTNNCGSTVAPGASCTINVTFTPSTTGTRSGTLTISTDAVNGGAQIINLSGTGIAPGAVLSPTNLSFANQLVNTSSAAQTATLSNPGTAPLTINSISVTGGDYSQTNNCGTGLAAGASCSINVIFTPQARGSRSGSVSVSSSAGPAPIAVNLSGTGIAPVASLSASSLAFAGQLVNTTSTPQAVTLTNSGDVTLNVSSIVVNSDFAQANNCGNTVAVGASCTINVTFTPTATGTRSGTLTITDDSSAGSQQTVSLSGIGIVAAATLSPASLSFGNQLVNSFSGSQSVTLSSSGTAALTIGSISASGDFTQTNNCGGSLAAGTSCTINVIFTPTATGARSGSLTITDNSFAGSQQTVSLSGTGIDFSLSASPSSVTISAGQAAHYTVTVSPLGGNFGSAVSLSCSGLPALSACSFSPAAPTLGSTSVNSTLSLTTTSRHSHSGTPAGTYTITINGTSGSRVQAVTVQLVVN